jgi:two-component system, NarL family, sensor histidine kinase DegS
MRNNNNHKQTAKRSNVKPEHVHHDVAALEAMLREHCCDAEALQTQNHLLTHLLDVEERKQKLMAYDIHDGLAQKLTGALHKFEKFRELQASNAAEPLKLLNVGVNLLRQAIQETHRLVSGLQSPLLEKFSMAAVIGEFIQESRELAVVDIEYYHDIQTCVLPLSLVGAVFRIVQESLINACCHSKSKKIQVELTEQDRCIRILVRDWGIGFDPENVEEGHFGLQGIQARAEQFGGKAVITSSPGSGASIFVEIPTPDVW